MSEHNKARQAISKKIKLEKLLEPQKKGAAVSIIKKDNHS